MYDLERLHPAAVIENLIRNIYKFFQILIGPLVIIATSPLSKRWLVIIAIVGLGAYFLISILSWYRFRYAVYNEELRIEYGILARRKTYIPIERIQSMQITTGIVQRIFGLVKVDVQTAGGSSEAKASLSAITKEQASKLQAQLNIIKHSTDMNEKISVIKNKKHLTLKTLLIAATTSNGIGVVLVGGLAVLSQINQHLPNEDIYTKIGESIINYAGDTVWIYLLSLLFILILAWILSIIGTIISIGGFTISRLEDRLLVQRGLIEKREISIPLNKIQAIKIVEGILRQPFGLATIQVVSAGIGSKSTNDTIAFPLLAKKEIPNFLAEFLPEYKTEITYTPLAKAAQNRYRLILTIPTLLAVIPILCFFNYGFLALLIAVLAWFWGKKQYKDAGINIEEEQIAIRYRLIGLNTYLIKHSKIQAIKLKQNPFQKRKNIKAIEVYIASSRAGSTVGLTGIKSSKGDEILNWYREF
ncbi:MAG: PH domain-containing protein [Syntrophomonadaceae bacterium]|nr:PH domain-containing protein [Syntrophomonadaceae bacterium]